MAQIHIDDEHLQEAVLRAVRELLANEESRLRELSNEFIESATKARRESLKQVEQSADAFVDKGRAKLAEADRTIEDFNTKLTEKKKKAEEALNLKVIGGFTGVMILLTLGVLTFLGERLVTVNTKVKEVTEKATELSTTSGDLQKSITDANTVYKQVAESAKGTDFATQLQTMNLLTNRIDADVKQMQKTIEGIRDNLKPLQAEYAERHPRHKKK